MPTSTTIELPPRTIPGGRVVWEGTRACERACPGCPQGFPRWREPGELSTIEAMLLVNRLRARGCRLLAVTGGDPTRRNDLEDLVRHAARLGMEVEVTFPGGVAPPGARMLARLREAGLTRIVVRRCGEAPGEDRAFEVIAAARAAGLDAFIGDSPETGLRISASGEILAAPRSRPMTHEPVPR